MSSPLRSDRERPQPSLLRCFTVLGLLIASVVGLFVSLSIYDGLLSHYSSIANPHRAHHDSEPTALGKPSPVYPLFDNDTVFDVAATVWLQYTADELDGGIPSGLRVTHGINERALASEVVLRGVNMKTLNAMSSVEFDLPLTHFRQPNITMLDLRGAITLIPEGGSKLDRVLEYSDWRPPGAEAFPRRSNPFPLHPSSGIEKAPSLREDIIEHWGTSFPLLEFWEVETQCAVSPKEAASYDLAPDDGSLKLEVEVVDLPVRPDGVRLHKRHPHIVTRTHAFITDENRPYNRTTFDKQHERLKKMACRSSPTSPASWTQCFRTYERNGHRELRLVLEADDGSDRREVAYGPYIGKVAGGTGPKDIVPLPVNREDCKEWRDGAAPATPDSMRVTWTIHFSSLTPSRLHLFENMVSRNRFPFNATAREQAHILKDWEQSVALFGQKLTPNHRPKTRIIVHASRQLFSLAGYLLFIAYWYTRTTTAGISVVGTALCIPEAIIESVTQTIWALQDHDASIVYRLLIGAFVSFFGCLPMYFAAQVVSPVTLKWHSRRSISLQRAMPTHRERASRRLEASGQVKVMVLLGAFIFLYTAAYFNIYVIAPSLPAHTKADLGRHFVWQQFFNAVTDSLAVTGAISQYYLNFRSGTFGGSYRLTTWFTLGATLLSMVYLSQHIVGTFDAGEGFTIAQLSHLLMQGIACYQAYSLPRVEQSEPEN